VGVLGAGLAGFTNKSPKTKRDVAKVRTVAEAGIVFDRKNEIVFSSSESNNSAHFVKESISHGEAMILGVYSAVRGVRGQMPKHTKSPTFQHTTTAPSHLIRAFNFTDTTSCIWSTL